MKGIAFELAIIVLLTLANGFFAGAEIAMLAVRKTALSSRAEKGSRAAKIALSLRAHPERFLATVQVGITVIGATAAAFAGATLARELGVRLVRFGMGAELAEDLALAFVIGTVSTLSIILGELVPKSLALRHAVRFTMLAAPVLGAIAWLARPIVWFLTLASNLVLRPFGDHTSFGEARLSPEELQQLVEEAATEGTVHRDAGELASRALDLPSLRIDAVCVPRGDVVYVHRDRLRVDLIGALSTSPHDRYPVVEQGLDDAMGYVVVREVAALLTGTDAELLSRVRPLTFVPASHKAIDVMRDMQRTGNHLVMVVDEQGVIIGLVAMGDLLEELVGEILSEGETTDHLLQPEPGGPVLASGRVGIHEVNRALELDLPENLGVATIGGLVIATAGRIPDTGTRVELDAVTLEVVEASPRRVLTVRIHPKPRLP